MMHLTEEALHKKVAFFTGHRPQRLPWRFDETDERHKLLLSRLQAAITEAIAAGYTTFLNGGAIGVDMWAAELILQLKEQYPEVELHMIVPCGDQEQRWALPLKTRYYRILSRADSVVVLHPHYVRGCMAHRNRYMAERSSRLIGVYDGMPGGGTLQTLSMARQQGIDIYVIAP